MHATPFECPAELPLFPLRGVLLLPGGRLPLNVFEPRYLAMVSDALGAGRLIGMIQPQDNTGSSDKESALYSIGCAGRIVQFEETADGRFLITLLGVCRFRLETETGMQLPYRRSCVSWTEFAKDPADATPQETLPDRKGFITAACRYLERQGMSFEQDSVAEAPLDRLTTAIAMICPFSPEEKQALLEAADTTTRTAMLLALMEMALYQSGEGIRRPQFN
jgi:Lon protease-like protein